MHTEVTLYTHDGACHADDAFAAAILSIIYPESRVIRTRDLGELKRAAGKPGNFLLDVGGFYDARKRLFDHHQPSGAGFRDPATRRWPYATAGLVWRHYGAQAVKCLHPMLSDNAIEEVVDHIDLVILRYIDAVDCGVKLKTAGPSISALVASFNGSWYESEVDQFPLIKALCQEILINFVRRQAGKVMARDRIRASPRHLDGQVLVLDSCLPWTEVVAQEMPDVLLVAYPVGDKTRPTWQIRTACGVDRQPRMFLPIEWAGYERLELSRRCAEPSALFCHRSRYLAGALTLEGVLAMAQSAIKAHKEVAQVIHEAQSFSIDYNLLIEEQLNDNEQLMVA